MVRQARGTLGDLVVVQNFEARADGLSRNPK
jgi:hypothetical protein